MIGIIVALIALFFMKVKGKKELKNDLLIELPEYKMPSIRTVWIYVWEKVKDYLTKAGTTIFIASIIMWFLLNFGTSGYSTDMTNSFCSVIGLLL